MKYVINQVSFQIVIADTFMKRFKGLLGIASLNYDEGLLLLPCNSVHMLGMRYAIDVVYLDHSGCIIKLVEDLHPWYGCSLCTQAYSTLEVNVGVVQHYGWKIGQKLIQIEE